MTDEIQPIPLLDLRAQYATIRESVKEALDSVLDSQYFILGPEVQALEAEVASYSECAFGIGVSSGTDALLIALMALDLQPGDEVILPSYTFFATAGAVARLGGVPVFVDIEPETYNIDPAKIEAAITEKSRALIPVHLYGQMADMDPIMEVARHHKLCVIEDAAQAIGSEYKGKRAGSIGHMGCFSFFPSKNLGAFGDAGMVTTNESAFAERLKLLRNHGYKPKYYNKIVGGNFRLDAIQAAVLRVKLPYLDSWTEARQHNASTYRRLFHEAGLLGESGTAAITLPAESGACKHIYNQFVIRSLQRDQLMEHLKRHKIGSEIYYPVPLHLQECFQYLHQQEGAFQVSELAAKQTLALPIYPELTESMLQRVVESIAEFFRGSVARTAP